jgi:Ca2+-binding EF-hand superfamily protein
MTPQQKVTDPVNRAQINAKSPFGTVFDTGAPLPEAEQAEMFQALARAQEQDMTIEELIQLIGRG